MRSQPRRNSKNNIFQTLDPDLLESVFALLVEGHRQSTDDAGAGSADAHAPGRPTDLNALAMTCRWLRCRVSEHHQGLVASTAPFCGGSGPHAAPMFMPQLELGNALKRPVDFDVGTLRGSLVFKTPPVNRNAVPFVSGQVIEVGVLHAPACHSAGSALCALTDGRMLYLSLRKIASLDKRERKLCVERAVSTLFSCILAVPRTRVPGGVATAELCVSHPCAPVGAHGPYAYSVFAMAHYSDGPRCVVVDVVATPLTCPGARVRHVRVSVDWIDRAHGTEVIDLKAFVAEKKVRDTPHPGASYGGGRGFSVCVAVLCWKRPLNQPVGAGPGLEPAGQPTRDGVYIDVSNRFGSAARFAFEELQNPTEANTLLLASWLHFDEPVSAPTEPRAPKAGPGREAGPRSGEPAFLGHSPWCVAASFFHGGRGHGIDHEAVVECVRIVPDSAMLRSTVGAVAVYDSKSAHGDHAPLPDPRLNLAVCMLEERSIVFVTLYGTRHDARRHGGNDGGASAPQAPARTLRRTVEIVKDCVEPGPEVLSLLESGSLSGCSIASLQGGKYTNNDLFITGGPGTPSRASPLREPMRVDFAKLSNIESSRARY